MCIVESTTFLRSFIQIQYHNWSIWSLKQEKRSRTREREKATNGFEVPSMKLVILNLYTALVELVKLSSWEHGIKNGHSSPTKLYGASAEWFCICCRWMVPSVLFSVEQTIQRADTHSSRSQFDSWFTWFTVFNIPLRISLFLHCQHLFCLPLRNGTKYGLRTSHISRNARTHTTWQKYYNLRSIEAESMYLCILDVLSGFDHV